MLYKISHGIHPCFHRIQGTFQAHGTIEIHGDGMRASSAGRGKAFHCDGGAGFGLLMVIAAITLVIPVFSYGGDIDALIVVAREGDLPAARALLDRGVNVNMKDSAGQTALGVAVYYGNLKMVQLLFDRGADVNAGRYDGVTALMIAAQNGYPGMVQYLLDRDAKVHVKTSRGKTVLMYAKESGRKDVIQLLRRAGAEH
jgi:hypothetical protein